MFNCIIIRDWYSHKLILSATCKYFKGIIADNPNEKEFVLNFTDYQINLILSFLYKKEQKLLKKDVFDLFVIADFLICDYLLDKIRNVLQNSTPLEVMMSIDNDLKKSLKNFYDELINKKYFI